MSDYSELFYEIITKNLDEFNADLLSKNPFLPLQIIEDYPNGINGRKWNLPLLSMNPALTLDFIENHKDGIGGTKWNLEDLVENHNLTLKFVEDHIILNKSYLIQNEFFFIKLSSNPIITSDFVRDHIDLPWSSSGLAKNPNITLDTIIEYLKYRNRMCYMGVCLEKSHLLTIDIIEEVMNNYKSYFVFNLACLSYNNVINEEFILKYPDGICNQKWCLNGICENSSISTKFACALILRRGKTFSRYFRSLLQNDNVDLEFLYKYNSDIKLLNYFRETAKQPKISKFSKLLVKSILHKMKFYSRHKKYSLLSLIVMMATMDFIEKHLDELRNTIKSGKPHLYKWLTFEFIQSHPDLFINNDDVFSSVCTLEYIHNNPDGYYINNRLVPWNFDIIAKRSFIRPTKFCKSANKIYKQSLNH